MSSSPRRPESPNTPISPLSLSGNAGADYISLRLDPITEHVAVHHSRPPLQRHDPSESFSSVSFKSKAHSEQPRTRPAPRSRIKSSSPPPASRFQHHISFDNFAAGDATDNNSISYCLNVKHTGYQFKRRSRTFMVGIDENDYSSVALQWMLEELVDDGDEVVCLRVVDKGSKVINNSNVEMKKYQKEAQELMDRIQKKNDDNRAISIILEFAVGKVSKTFMQMIQIYEPAMLIVGTRGRSLGGVQGLVSQRNSFSKWCLQYSPIPVVVVRPTEKRMKKKIKREADPARQDYARILRESGVGEHETNSGTTHVDFETLNTPEQEAHKVAAALGLPAAFDPTLKPLMLPGSHQLRKVESGNSEALSEVTSISKSSVSPDSRPVSPEINMKSPKSPQLESPDDYSSEGEGDDEEEGEFEVIPGLELLGNGDKREPDPIDKKMKLHEMEVGEAKALLAPGGRKHSIGSTSSTGQEEDEAEIGEQDDVSQDEDGQVEVEDEG